jgi:hypothetical protein
MGARHGRESPAGSSIIPATKEALNKSVLDFSAPLPKNLVGAQLCCAMIARRSRAPTINDAGVGAGHARDRNASG